jgi:preprotein translocase subunit SecA
VDEAKLLEDLKNLARKAGGCSDAQAFGLTLDDFAVPPTQRTAPAKVGRNDPCPCGSGKKYKKCCMR